MSHEARDDRPRPSLLPEVDRGIIRGEAGLDIIRGLQGGVIQVDGWIDDDLAFTRDWGFDPRELTVPTYIWHGSADLMAPFHHAEWLAGDQDSRRCAIFWMARDTFRYWSVASAPC
jgi:pimeloyl-ACP methyl ester carboxylesterase